MLILRLPDKKEREAPRMTKNLKKADFVQNS